MNLLNQLMGIKDPDDFMKKQMESNPQFKKFVEDNRNKSPEQIAKDYNINPIVLNLLK